MAIAVYNKSNSQSIFLHLDFYFPWTTSIFSLLVPIWITNQTKNLAQFLLEPFPNHLDSHCFLSHIKHTGLYISLVHKYLLLSTDVFMCSICPVFFFNYLIYFIRKQAPVCISVATWCVAFKTDVKYYWINWKNTYELKIILYIKFVKLKTCHKSIVTNVNMKTKQKKAKKDWIWETLKRSKEKHILYLTLIFLCCFSSR